MGSPDRHFSLPPNFRGLAATSKRLRGIRCVREKSPAAGWCIPALLALGCLLVPRALFTAQESHYKAVEVKPHVFVWLADDILEQEGDPNFARAANAGFIVTPGGVVVVNTTNTPFNARGLLYEIRRHTDQPVRYVINTSGSPDAMLGNEAFTDFSPTILSTPAAASLINRYRSELPGRIENDWRLKATMRGIHPTTPDKTFSQEMTLPVRGSQIKLINLGDDASPGNSVVYLPQAKVVFLGNLFANQYIPRMDSGNLRGWIAALRRVETWNADVFVPVHGQPGDRNQVQQFRQFLEWLLREVQTRVQQGRSEQQIQDELVPFKPYPWHAAELEPRAVDAAYQEVIAGKKKPMLSTQTPAP